MLYLKPELSPFKIEEPIYLINKCHFLKPVSITSNAISAVAAGVSGHAYIQSMHYVCVCQAPSKY